MLNDLTKENNREKQIKEDEIKNRKDRVSHLLKEHKGLKRETEEIMTDFNMIKHPNTFEHYKKNNFRRWVGSDGKYLIPKTH